MNQAETTKPAEEDKAAADQVEEETDDAEQCTADAETESSATTVVL